MTKQFKKRAAILSCLRGTKSHPSAEMVYEMLRAENPDISLATVYRNLTLFKNQGLIRSLGTVDGVERFDGRVEPHVHFVCTGCDAVTDLDNVVLPQAVLDIPKFGCINLHVSLLPKYRGSAPVQWAVLNGDTETGVSIQQMDAGLDTGDVLVCEKVAIGPEETSGELFDRVTAVGARVLCETLPRIAAGTLTPTPQDHAAATLAPMLTKELAQFRWEESAAHIHNWVRGMNPWPAAWFVTGGGRKVKVLECRVAAQSGAPGQVLALKPLTVACGDGAVQLRRVVPEGSRPMEGSAFAAGLRLQVGDAL